MADHCRLFTLSELKEPAFQVQCDHEHKDSCDRCDQVVSTLSEIDERLSPRKATCFP